MTDIRFDRYQSRSSSTHILQQLQHLLLQRQKLRGTDRPRRRFDRAIIDRVDGRAIIINNHQMRTEAEERYTEIAQLAMHGLDHLFRSQVDFAIIGTELSRVFGVIVIVLST